MNGKRLFTLTLVLGALVAGGCSHTRTAAGDRAPGDGIDQRSYRLGSLGAFSEMVDLGIKRMALSAATTRAEMNSMIDPARRIAEEHDVKLHRERDFLLTDLFPHSATRGKEVLIIYQDDGVLEDYLALKKQKADLVARDAYAGQARHEIAWKLGKLLSYPDAKIAELIGRNAAKD